MWGRTETRQIRFPRLSQNAFCETSAIDCSNKSRQRANMKAGSVVTESHSLNEEDAVKLAKTPDNNDVPIKRKLSFAEWSDESLRSVELGESFNPISFIQPSDSLDNNCILNEESVEADYYGDLLDKFEGETVTRFRNDLFFSTVPEQSPNDRVKEYMSNVWTSAVSVAKFTVRSGLFSNKNENRYCPGYYSEYFDVNKPNFSNRIVANSSKMSEITSSERKGIKDQTVTNRRATTDRHKSSLKKKDISNLITYFESGVSAVERKSIDTALKIFEEVSAVRENEKYSSCVDPRRLSLTPESCLDLDLLSVESKSSDISPSIITPPVEFRNSFSSEAESVEQDTKAFDAVIYNAVSVKNLCHKFKSQESDYEGLEMPPEESPCGICIGPVLCFPVISSSFICNYQQSRILVVYFVYGIITIFCRLM